MRHLFTWRRQWLAKMRQTKPPAIWANTTTATLMFVILERNSSVRTERHSKSNEFGNILVNLLNQIWLQKVYLTICGAVGLDGPASLVGEGFEDLVVITVLRQLVVAVHSQAGEYLRRDRPPPPLPPLVVLPLLPRRHPSSRHLSPSKHTKHRRWGLCKIHINMQETLSRSEQFV